MTYLDPVPKQFVIIDHRAPLNVDFFQTLKTRFLEMKVPILKPLKLNRCLHRWNLPEPDKIKSLSGKQIAYRRLGINQDESKLNKLIKGTKVVAKNFCWPFSKKKGDKSSRL